jgi:hypothetical protein
MSLSAWNDGLDAAYLYEEPDDKRMENDWDYFEGFCYGDAINERHREDKRLEREHEEEMGRQYYEEQMERDSPKEEHPISDPTVIETNKGEEK